MGYSFSDFLSDITLPERTLQEEFRGTIKDAGSAVGGVIKDTGSSLSGVFSSLSLPLAVGGVAFLFIMMSKK